MEQAPQQPGSPAEIPAGTSLVVICREERSVRSTVSFLNRRGIPTKIVTNMNDAVDIFSKKQANMALLSVNYPHPKIEVIPSLLNQSFGVDCIAFAEDTDRKTTQKLSNIKARHVLFGPVSGPVVLMRVRQIEKESEEANSAHAAGSNPEVGQENSDDESGAIKVGGGKGDQGDRIQVKSKRRENPEDVANLMKDLAEEAGYQITKGEGLERSGGTIVQKGSRSSMKSATQSGPLDKSRRGELAARAFGRAIDRGLGEVSKAEKKSKLFIPPPPWTTPEKEAELEAREEAELLAEIEAEQAAELAREQEANEFERARAEAEARKDRSNASSSNDGADKSNGQPKANSPAPASAKPSGSLKPKPLRKPKSQQEDFFLKCLTDSMATVCGQPYGVSQGCAKSLAAGLVTVKSRRIEGAFVIQVGRSRLSPEAFLQRIEVAFFSLIRNSGVELGQGEQFAIELEDYEIVGNAFAASDYILCSSTPDHEVAIAVIPVTNTTPIVEPHKDNMVKVSVAEMPIDVPLTFDVFLHLPSNKKYMRYLKVGGKMSGKQSDKLGRYRVGSLFLNDKDKEAYRKHYAAQAIDPKKPKAS